MNMIERFEAMLATGQDSALLRFSLGNAYLKEGVTDKAVQHLQQAVAQDPDYSAAWKLYGKALAEVGKLDEAMQAYRTGIQTAQAKGDIQAAKEMQVFLRRLEKQNQSG